MKKSPPQTHVRAFRDDWIEWIGDQPGDDLLHLVGVSRSTWCEILAGAAPLVSVASMRLARFHRFGELRELAGDAWREFQVVGGALAVPGVRRAIPAGELRAWWSTVQELAALRVQVEQLRRELGRAQQAQEAAEARAWYYRRHLVAESRLALLLADA